MGRVIKSAGKAFGKHFAKKESDFSITSGKHPAIGMLYDSSHQPRIAQLPKTGNGKPF